MMDSKEKSQLTLVSKEEKFSQVYTKLILEEQLNNNEKTYILTVALLSLRVYQEDKSKKSYLEFAYFIILQYSLKHSDYKPLYDFSADFGFYPITKEILSLNLIETNIKDVLTNIQLENFKYKSYIETLEQNNLRNSLHNQDKEISITAPTSYGKSELIIEHIKGNFGRKKFAIIVPSKSLLNQTYKNLRNNIKDFKIIYHDEMYNYEEKFIAILTQERALRMLENDGLAFDVIYIDEAHNLLNRDHRNILLTRLLRINRLRNPQNSIIYLSPLIDDSNKLRLFEEQKIVDKRIDFNLKQPEYILKSSSNIQIYNRFSNQFYLKTEDTLDYLKYIKKNLKEKNFIYIRKPKDIEEFVRRIYNELPDITIDSKLEQLIKELENSIHEEYWMIKLIKKGIIYLHGKMPDILKEYLEYQFKEISALRILVSNHVILAGINLPIDNLYILTVHSLKEKDAINLIGRVNRLNYIFNGSENLLSKLIPKIHFVENPFNNVNMKTYIEKLRSNIFDEKVMNPILLNYDGTNTPVEVKEKDYKIIFIEDFILLEHELEIDKISKILFKNGIHNYIDYDIDYINLLRNKIESFNSKGKEVIDIIYEIFLKDNTNFKDDNIFYLTLEKNRNYFKSFINYQKHYLLKDYISLNFAYHKGRRSKGINLFFIGSSFGEVNKKGIVSEFYNENKWINISKKTDGDLINLILIKFKLDSDFLNYDLTNFVNTLYDLGILNEEEFNDITYGTQDKKIIELKRLGISTNLINKFSQDSMLEHLEFDNKNNLKLNALVSNYFEQLSDMEIFEISKFL